MLIDNIDVYLTLQEIDKDFSRKKFYIPISNV
jgi:hypothetical protein